MKKVASNTKSSAVHTNKTRITSNKKTGTVSKTGRVPKEEKFAEGLCFKKLFFIFLIGSVIGTVYEDVLIFVRTWMETGTGVWMLHRGVIYGPFNVIYGFGAVVMCWFLLRKKYDNLQIFVYGALLGGVVEYVVSWLQEFFTHTTSWDYSGQFLSINGRTTVPIMMVWGVLGLVLVKFLYPLASDLIEKIPVKTGDVIFAGMAIFMALDMLLSWTVLLRQTLRHNNIPPFTPIGEFYDSYYNDERLEYYFPNMVHEDKK